MTYEQAKKEIAKANTRIERLRKSEFRGNTPATKALEQRLNRLGYSTTNKGYISTRGMSESQIRSLGTQAKQFNVNVTSTPKGTRTDISNRTNTLKEHYDDLTDENMNSLYKIFNSNSYKRLKEIAGSDAVVSAVAKKLKDKPNINIRRWLYRQELALRKNEKTIEEILNIPPKGIDEIF